MRKRFLAVVLAVVCTLSMSAVGTFAATLSTGTANATVNLTIPESYTVTIPDVITLTPSSTDAYGFFTVTAAGKLDDTKVLHVKCPTSIALENGTSAVTAAITFTDPMWTEIEAEGNSQNGTISVSDLSTATKAGLHSGTLTFTVTYE